MERCTSDTWEVLALELVGCSQEHGKVHLGGACFRTGGVLHRSMERCTSDTCGVLYKDKERCIYVKRVLSCT